MFIGINKLTTMSTDPLNRELVKREETIFLFEGQTANSKNTSQETQNYYKKLYKIQEDATLEAGRPVCIFEALKIGL